jgi:N-acetylglucosamine-6-phosphate deacetylase
LSSIVRAKSPAKTILVTDAVCAAAQPPGRYNIGAVQAELSATGRVSLVGAEKTLAGSALTLDAAVARTAAYTGLSLDEVLPMATTQAARAVGCEVAGHVTATWDEARHQLTIDRVEGV